MKTLIAAAVTALALTLPVKAADYPSGPVTIVVPYSPSGNTDVFTRHLAPYLEKKWGQPVVVDNKPGGGSMIGTALVSQAEPDGPDYFDDVIGFHDGTGNSKKPAF